MKARELFNAMAACNPDATVFIQVRQPPPGSGAVVIKDEPGARLSADGWVLSEDFTAVTIFAEPWV